MPSPDQLTITDIAIHLGVSRWTVSRLVSAGDIPSTPGPGRFSRIAAADYRKWLSAQVITPNQEDGDMTALPELISLETVAEKYSLSLRSLREGARAKRFRHIQIGHSRYFTEAQLAEFFAARTVTTAEDDAKDAMRERRQRRQTRPPRTKAA